MNGNAGRVINAPKPTPIATPVFDGATVEDVDKALLDWTKQNPDSPIKIVDRHEGRRSAARPPARSGCSAAAPASRSSRK